MKILDGGLATELESRGHDLDDDLWSAKLLRDQPDEIVAAHQAFINAGAEVITSGSYQATLPGFRKAGMTSTEAENLLRLSIRLAKQARGHSPTVQVAASIGPYGAFLANGAEYTGKYDLDQQGLMEFHDQRWQILASENPDIMLCETVPSLTEATALAQLAVNSNAIPVWISFSCRDGNHISDGTEIRSVIRELHPYEQITAVGINCTPPKFLPELIPRIRLETDKPIVVYPNSGESFDANSRTWSGSQAIDDFATQAAVWRQLGASIIGGCCRVTPAHIASLKSRLQ
ncbi:MAG: homocysteine S-methyltransferase [Planctomycetaceae bacterium]|nr:homocysteine S-methyltransferase [Planctomycetaceae bacterium]